MDMTDAQWAIIEPLIPKPRRRKDRRGRPWREPGVYVSRKRIARLMRRAGLLPS